MSTLAEFMMLSGGDNRLPMLEKHLIKKYEELSATEKIQADCDLKATNIILQGLPSDERECKLYDAFDKFAHINGESLHQYYLRFTQLINEINIQNEIEIYIQPNFDQLHTYLEQHELHANEVCIMREHNQDPLALVANHQMTLSHVRTYQSSYNNPYQGSFYGQFVKLRIRCSLLENEITSDSNIIPYSQYLLETQNAADQDNVISNESLSAELERYKERVKLLEERQNVDLSTREKLIMDDIIQDKEAKNIDKEIALEKKVKELDNIVCQIGQSAQSLYMLTKLQVFYDNNLKQAFGFKNPFYLKKAQQIMPILYDDSVIAEETHVISIADSEETLMVKEESRSKMLLKQSDPMVLEKKVNIKPINYAKLNLLSKDFGKPFVPQHELSNEQAFRLQTSHSNTDQSASLLVKIMAPRELPKKMMENASE
nr:hypothetical protein [Tanacetum cinerariifolium]